MQARRAARSDRWRPHSKVSVRQFRANRALKPPAPVAASERHAPGALAQRRDVFAAVHTRALGEPATPDAPARTALPRASHFFGTVGPGAAIE